MFSAAYGGVEARFYFTPRRRTTGSDGNAGRAATSIPAKSIRRLSHAWTAASSRIASRSATGTKPSAFSQWDRIELKPHRPKGETEMMNHGGHRGTRRKLKTANCKFAICSYQFAIRSFSVFLCVSVSSVVHLSAASLADVVAGVQPKVVKIYGAGGPSGLEPYQSGFLITEGGHVLTAWSYVLDADEIDVTLDDGRKFSAKLVGADVRTEIAVLKIDAGGLAHFKLDDAATIEVGGRVLALSNLYGVATGSESASVQHGVVAARTTLAARRGVYNSPYQGAVYVLDAMTNNPGAAGGALVNLRGELVGVLGKELRHARTGNWLNYALPIAEVTRA